MKLVRKSLAIAATASVLFFTACKSSSDSSTSAATDTEEVATEEPAEDVASADNTVAELTIHGDDMMKYDLSELTVTAGQKVKLTLVHSGKLPKASMGHNWVLLNHGVDATAFATKAISAKDHDYIPQDALSDIIAHTDLVGGGESTTIEFTAPAAGEYDYICTFPGHSAIMKGKLIVK